MFLQELPEPEKVTSSSQLVLFVRRWCAANLELQSFQEVLLDGSTVVELKNKVGCVCVEFTERQQQLPWFLELQNLMFFPVHMENSINKMHHECNIFTYETHTNCLQFILLSSLQPILISLSFSQTVCYITLFNNVLFSTSQSHF